MSLTSLFGTSLLSVKLYCSLTYAPLMRALANAAIGLDIACRRRRLASERQAAAVVASQRPGRVKGQFDAELDAHYRRRIPEAEYVAYGYGEDGHRYIGDQGEASVRIAKEWRGFRLVVLSEGITGLPLVGVLVRGGRFEPHTLMDLLSLLFSLWPDAPVAEFVADKLWDVDAIVELLETRYGIHPVVIKPSLLRTSKHFGDEGAGADGRDKRAGKYRGGVGRLNGDGTAYCRIHGSKMQFEGTECPSRVGLEPGEATDARGFRSRWRCPNGCRPSMPTRLTWRTLTFYPPHSARPARSVCETARSSQSAQPGGNRLQLDEG